MPDFQSTLEQRMQAQPVEAVKGANYPGEVLFQSRPAPQTQQTLELDGDQRPDDTTAGVGVLVVKDGQILTGTRIGEDMLGGPGGHIKVGESPLAAAVREAQEEFGIRPRNLRQIAQVKRWPGRYAGSTVFLCTDYDGEICCDDVEMCDPAFRTVADLLHRCRYQPETMFPPFAYSLFNFLYTMIPLAGERLAEEAETEQRLSPELLGEIRRVVNEIRGQTWRVSGQ